MAEDHEHKQEEELMRKADDDESDDWLFCERDTDSEDDEAAEESDDDEAADESDEYEAAYEIEDDEAANESDDGEAADESDDDEAADESDDDEAAGESDDDEAADHERSRCLDVHVCQHAHERFEGGLPFLEIFKVKLKFNDELSTNKPFKDARLCGEIVTQVPEHEPFRGLEWDDDNLFPISFYRVSPYNPDILLNLDSSNRNNSILLPISGPKPRPILYDGNDVGVRFAFKVDDEDVFNNGYPHVNPHLFGNHKPTKHDSFDWDPNCGGGECVGPYTITTRIGDSYDDRILFSAHYAVYRGSCATVEVKILKEGVCGFYGSIVARPCVFYSRIRLLTIQRADSDKEKLITIQRDDTGEVGSGGRIKLTRSTVAVPISSSLIIGADLYDDDDDDGERICCGRAAFAAKESGEETRYISYKGVRALEVKVQWRCDYEFHNKEFVK